MEALSDLLGVMNVEDVAYVQLEASAPWSLFCAAPKTVKFGMVTRGGCWISIEHHDEPIYLATGDCLMLTNCTGFNLSDRLQASTRGSGSFPCEAHANSTFTFGGGGSPTTMVGGNFTFSNSQHLQLGSIFPSFIHLRASEMQNVALGSILTLLTSEIEERAFGSNMVIGRLISVLFIQAARSYLASQPTTSGWLAALSDPRIGSVLNSMHQQISEEWTVAGMAARAGMSRSAFSSLFKQLVGEPPLENLTRWRMHQAGQLLAETSLNLAHIANRVGYESESAFSKTFKRLNGVAPGEYRRHRAYIGR